LDTNASAWIILYYLSLNQLVVNDCGFICLLFIARDDDTGNNMHWFEELRKLRVAHLKRELELYDGSIGYAG